MESIAALIIAAAGIMGAYHYGKSIGKDEGIEEGICAASEYYAREADERHAMIRETLTEKECGCHE
jgi:hypothetical protein